MVRVLDVLGDAVLAPAAMARACFGGPRVRPCDVQHSTSFASQYTSARCGHELVVGHPKHLEVGPSPVRKSRRST